MKIEFFVWVICRFRSHSPERRRKQNQLFTLERRIFLKEFFFKLLLSFGIKEYIHSGESSRNNRIFFVILYIYGYLMSKWFFQRSKIQPSLPLALVTHNPVQAIVNLYIISFTVIKYGIQPVSFINIMALFTLYFPALIWEISRKIRAPKDENAYTTYSKLFGYKKATKFVMFVTLIDIVTNFILVWNLNKISIIILAVLASWMTWTFIRFIKDPKKFTLVTKVEHYTFLQEATMLLTIITFLIIGKI